MRTSTLASVMKASLAGAVAVSLITGCASQGSEQDSAASVEGEFNWKRYEGTEIRFVQGLQPWQKAVEPLIPEFEERTGIKVQLEALPEDQFRQRLQVEMTAGSDDIDVFMSSVQNDGARFAQAGWYEDLTPYVENASLTAPDYDFADFSKSVLEGHTFDGKLSALPIQLEVQMLFYRKDLLEKAGFDAPPATLEELETMAAKMTDNEVFGFSARGKRAAAVTQLTSFLRNHGGDYMSEDGKAAFNSPEGIEAMKTYGKLVREYGPSGGTNNSWEELLALFQSGRLAMWPDNSGQAAAVRDPKASSFADQVGYAPMPAGPKGNAQSFFGWGAAVSSASANKGASWLFLQWLTGPEVVGKLQTQGIPGGRQSVEFGQEVPADFVEAFRSSLAAAKPQLPAVKAVPQVRDVIGDVIVTSIQGGDVDQAAQNAAKEFDRIVAAE